MSVRKYTVKKKNSELYVKPGKKHELTEKKNEAVKMTLDGIHTFFKNMDSEEYEIIKF